MLPLPASHPRPRRGPKPWVRRCHRDAPFRSSHPKMPVTFRFVSSENLAGESLVGNARDVCAITRRSWLSQATHYANEARHQNDHHHRDGTFPAGPTCPTRSPEDDPMQQDQSGCARPAVDGFPKAAPGHCCRPPPRGAAPKDPVHLPASPDPEPDLAALPAIRLSVSAAPSRPLGADPEMSGPAQNEDPNPAENTPARQYVQSHVRPSGRARATRNHPPGAVFCAKIGTLITIPPQVFHTKRHPVARERPQTPAIPRNPRSCA